MGLFCRSVLGSLCGSGIPAAISMEDDVRYWRTRPVLSRLSDLSEDLSDEYL